MIINYILKKGCVILKEYILTIKKVDSTSMDMSAKSMDIAIAEASNLINHYIEEEMDLGLIFCEKTSFIYEIKEKDK